MIFGYNLKPIELQASIGLISGTSVFYSSATTITFTTITTITSTTGTLYANIVSPATPFVG